MKERLLLSTFLIIMVLSLNGCNPRVYDNTDYDFFENYCDDESITECVGELGQKCTATDGEVYTICGENSAPADVCDPSGTYCDCGEDGDWTFEVGCVYVIFEDNGNTEEFCGSSTEYACETNSDCKIAGCSSQLCMGSDEGGGFTTCDARICYNNEIYGLECGCFENKCQWDSTF